MAIGKRLKKAREGVNREKLYPLAEAIKMVKERAKSKFDETVEIAINLGVDPRHADQMVRGVVTLPNGTFTTNLIGSRFLYSFTSRAFLNAFFQYNADTHQVSSNIRFNLIHHPLSDLYLVYNDTRETTTRETVGRALMIKVTNLFNF